MKDVDVGQIIGNKYVLVRLLGAGAMGQVWAARHQALQQTFAIKLMIPPRGAEQAYEGVETSLRRFRNEAQIAAALSRKSRHIVAVTDYEIDDGTAYLVMELLEGDGLDSLIGDGNRLRPEEVSHVITQIAKGLAVAHDEGVTHRDLKPANVFLTKTEEGDLLVKLLDFGIAQMARRIVKTKDSPDRAPTRLTMKGLVLGSPGYMSPEQAMAENPDHRADVWSLAVLAFEALVGVTPFFAKGADETILRICNFQSTPLKNVMPDASPELCAVFERAFAGPIDKRFQTVAGFAGTLAAALPSPARRLVSLRPPRSAHSPVPTDIEGVSLKLPLRPRKLVPAIAAGAGLGLIIAGVIFIPRLLAQASRTTSTSPTHGAMASAPSRAVGVLPPPPAPPTTAAPSSTDRVLQVSQLPTSKHVPTATMSVPATVAPPPTTTTTATPTTTVDRSAIF